MSPMRSGFIITPSIVTSEPGTISAATSGKAAEDGSAGTTTSVPRSVGCPVSAMRAAVAVRPVRRHRDLGAEQAQHPLGVVAGGRGLDHRRGARAR